MSSSSSSSCFDCPSPLALHSASALPAFSPHNVPTTASPVPPPAPVCALTRSDATTGNGASPFCTACAPPGLCSTMTEASSTKTWPPSKPMHCNMPFDRTSLPHTSTSDPSWRAKTPCATGVCQCLGALRQIGPERSELSAPWFGTCHCTSLQGTRSTLTLKLLPGRCGACRGTLVLRHHDATHIVHRKRHEKARRAHHQPSIKTKA